MDTTLERAFQLARSGEYATLSEIKVALRLEGYALGQFEGRTLQAQLRAIMKTAKQQDDE